MAGIYIQCGSFDGDDKSGSAIEGLLTELSPMCSAPEKSMVSRIGAVLKGGAESGAITVSDAAILLPLLKRYVDAIQARYGPISSPDELIERDHVENPKLDSTAAKWGEGRGWRYYCAVDLLTACETAARESQPIILTWD